MLKFHSDFLSKLGIPEGHQMYNDVYDKEKDFIDRTDEWIEYKKKNGISPVETWDLGNTTIPQWLYVQLSAFMEQSEHIIAWEWEYNKILFEGEYLTEREILTRMINNLAWICVAIEHDYYGDYVTGSYNREIELQLLELTEKKFDEVTRLLSKVWRKLWW